jgi:hypothetical protein
VQQRLGALPEIFARFIFGSTDRTQAQALLAGPNPALLQGLDADIPRTLGLRNLSAFLPFVVAALVLAILLLGGEGNPISQDDWSLALLARQPFRKRHTPRPELNQSTYSIWRLHPFPQLLTTYLQTSSDFPNFGIVPLGTLPQFTVQLISLRAQNGDLAIGLAV